MLKLFDLLSHCREVAEESRAVANNVADAAGISDRTQRPVMCEEAGQMVVVYLIGRCLPMGII